MGEENVEHKLHGSMAALRGRLKRMLGKWMGRPGIEAEGAAQEAGGRIESTRGAAGERIEGKMEEAAGAVKRTVGEITGDARKQADGRARSYEGHERQDVNR